MARIIKRKKVALPELQFHAIDWNAFDEVDKEELDSEESDKSSTSESDSETPDSDEEEEVREVQKKKFVIYAHGLLSDGTDIGLKITDYTPYFFFKVPTRNYSICIISKRIVITFN